MRYFLQNIIFKSCEWYTCISSHAFPNNKKINLLKAYNYRCKYIILTFVRTAVQPNTLIFLMCRDLWFAYLHNINIYRKSHKFNRRAILCFVFAGTLELRQAICDFHARFDNLTDLDPDDVIVGPGSKELIFLLMNVFNGGIQWMYEIMLKYMYQYIFIFQNLQSISF